MDTNLSYKSCRICSIKTNTDSGIPLFGEQAVKLFLQEKIKKYLSLTVSAGDKLPKMICLDCCRRIDGFHKFATMALQNQEKMTKFLDTYNNTDKSQSEHEQKPEIKSLLHSYLTKEVKDEESPLEAQSATTVEDEVTEDESTEITEVEVRVDPMMILQLEMDEDEYTSETESENNKTDHSDSISNGDVTTDRLYEVETYSNRYHKPYRCVACPRSFTSEFALQNHCWSHISHKKKALELYNNCLDNTHDHNDIEQVDSDKSSGSEKEEEIGGDEFACPVCSKNMSTKANLQMHLESHRPKGRFGCDICGRIFKTSCNLHRHKEYHGGVQYPCNICGRVYPTNSTLRAHSITHSDLRPHKCPLCDKTFKRNQDLKFHINQHTGARPYQCPYCPKAFASSGNCFSHRKRMHPIEVERDRERAAKIM